MRGRRLQCTDAQLIGLVELSVKRAAKDWFREQILPYTEGMTWQQFKDRFIDYFLSFATRETFRLQFMNISKGDKSVDDYTTEYIRLSRFASEMIVNEMRKNHHYVTGLGPHFASLNSSCRLQFTELVNEARNLEKILITHGTIPDSRQGKRQVVGGQSSSQQPTRFTTGSGQGSGSGFIPPRWRRGPFKNRSMHQQQRGRGFSPGGSSGSGGQSFGSSSLGSVSSVCQTCTSRPMSYSL